MLKKAAFAAFAVSMLVGLASCGTTKTPDNDISDVYGNTEIDKQLADAANRAAQAQEKLARVEIARTTPTPSPLDDTSLPEELKRPATIDWSGPAQEAARKIAALIGYHFQVTGNPPSIPVMVQMSVQDATAAKALEQIGLQSHPFGEVAVDPNTKSIEFRYLQAQQQPVKPTGTSPSWGK
jgi:defect-in-organelle-trafficking protein DotD